MSRRRRPKTLILGLASSLVLLLGILFIFDTPDNYLGVVLGLLIGILGVMLLAFLAASLIAFVRRKWRDSDQ